MSKHKEKLEYSEYFDELNEEEKAWVKQFYQEYYFGYNPKSPIITGQKKLDVENLRNSRRRDIYEKAELSGALVHLNERDTQFMEDASDDWEWADEYYRSGFEATFIKIMEQSIEELENKMLDRKFIFMKFYNKTNDLRKLHNREKRSEG